MTAPLIVGTPWLSQKTAALSHTFSGFPATTAGNLLVAVITLRTSTSATVSSVTDGTHTWTRRTFANRPTGALSRIEIWTAPTTASISSLTVNVTASYACSLMLYAVGGHDTAAPFDAVTAEGTASSDTTSDTTWNAGTLTPTAGGDYLLIHGVNWASLTSVTTFTPPSGYTADGWADLTSTLSAIGTISRQITGASGSSGGSITTNVSTGNGYAAIALKGAAASSLTPLPITGQSTGAAADTAAPPALNFPMAGISSSISTETATPTPLSLAIAGMSAGNGLDAGGLTLALALAGLSAGQGADTAAPPALSLPLAGTAAGSAPDTGLATLALALAGLSAGQSVDGTEPPILPLPLVGLSSSVAADNAALTLALALLGESVGVALDTGVAPILGLPLAGLSAGVALDTGLLGIPSSMALVGVSASTGAATATLDPLLLSLSGASAGMALDTATADAVRLVLSGTSASAAVDTGDVVLVIWLAGASASEAGDTAILIGPAPAIARIGGLIRVAGPEPLAVMRTVGGDPLVLVRATPPDPVVANRVTPPEPLTLTRTPGEL